MLKDEIKKLRAENKKLRQLLIKDELTGVLNRKGIKEEFEDLFSEISHKKNHSELKRKICIDDLSILFIDIDDFKKVNDTFGHEAGDKALEFIANVLKKKTRGIDAVGRFGGEEFVVALVGSSEDNAFEKAEEIRLYIKDNAIAVNRKKIKITLSAGVASIKKCKTKNLMELISMADKAMYEAKHNSGKDNTVKYSEIASKQK